MAPMHAHPPAIVAIETSTETASVAVMCRGTVLERESSGVLTHSASVLPMLQQLLDQADLTLADCDTLAFGCGPGSFTGVRTACGLVQGLATGAQKPVISIITLLAMADAARAAGAGNDVVAVLDARMGEVYWAHYRFDGDWVTVVEPTLARAAEVRVPDGAAICGNGLLAYAEDFSQAGGTARFPDVLPRAATIAALAANSLARGEILAARDAQPLYLRNKVALTTIERLAGAGA